MLVHRIVSNIIPLTICFCKSAWKSIPCRCEKYYLNCSDACKCLNCENVAEIKHLYEQVADSDSDDSSLSWKIQAWKLEFWMTCFILGVNFYSVLITFHNLFLNFHLDLCGYFLSSLTKSKSSFFCMFLYVGGQGGRWQLTPFLIGNEGGGGRQRLLPPPNTFFWVTSVLVNIFTWNFHKENKLYLKF